LDVPKRAAIVIGGFATGIGGEGRSCLGEESAGDELRKKLREELGEHGGRITGKMRRWQLCGGLVAPNSIMVASRTKKHAGVFTPLDSLSASHNLDQLLDRGLLGCLIVVIAPTNDLEHLSSRIVSSGQHRGGPSGQFSWSTDPASTGVPSITIKYMQQASVV
jgi:hypothetical protein